ncbi:tryptophanyl-tRNA synthetase [Xylogone sp. PMI_703]|nr:tryptophanyl-tRNA synthetase [Xylogone sp. PMI_703]
MENPSDNPDALASQEQSVTPWSVTGEIGEDGKVKAIDYTKLVENFGTSLIDDALLERFRRVTGQEPHRFLRRKIVFSHRDLEAILDRYERNEPFFCYTGRGPSSDGIHIGHVIPFELTKWLSDVFDAPLIIMLTDDEKYLISGPDTDVTDFERYARENAKDIIATGLNPDRTFIFSDYSYMGNEFYKNITRIAKRINRGTADAAFGFTSSTSIGKVQFPAVQAATSFANSFPEVFGSDPRTASIPCLIPCAIDQDVYFRLTRDVAQQLKYAKPSLIHSKFLDALQGPGSKMSASIDSSAIKVTDSPKQILKKIQGAFSGGQPTVEEHREKGGDPEIDVSYQYLRFFLDDDEELEQIRQDYKSGKMLTGEIKKRCADELAKYCTAFQERRAKVTDEVLDHFMTPRPLLFRGTSTLSFVENSKPSESASAESGKDPNSKNQAKKLAKQQAVEAKKAQKALEKEAKVAGAVPDRTRDPKAE